jgi:hypothetical protein
MHESPHLRWIHIAAALVALAIVNLQPPAQAQGTSPAPNVQSATPVQIHPLKACSTSNRISAGGHAYPVRTQDRASSFALRPSFQWRALILGGAYSNQSSMERMSCPPLWIRREFCFVRAIRSSLTFAATLPLAVSITICPRSQDSYSRETTSCQVGSLNPLISALLVSTLFRCCAGSEHVTSTSTALACARSATLIQASRVSRSGLTESATTVLPRRRHLQPANLSWGSIHSRPHWNKPTSQLD